MEHAVAMGLGPSPELLRPLHEVNERLLDYLVQSARGRYTATWRLVLELLDLLQDLNDVAVRRAARTSFLLVDLEFRREDWWRTATSPAQPGVPSAGEAPAAILSLTRATLTLGWHCSRAGRREIQFLLGLSPAVAAVLATLQLADIDRVAEQHAVRLQPRWADRPMLWRQLLRAAQATDAAGIRNFTLHGLQLAAADLMLATPELTPGRIPLHSGARPT